MADRLEPTPQILALKGKYLEAAKKRTQVIVNILRLRKEISDLEATLPTHAVHIAITLNDWRVANMIYQNDGKELPENFRMYTAADMFLDEGAYLRNIKSLLTSEPTLV
jgi:hypothetical protein